MPAPRHVVHLVSSLGVGGQEMVILQLVRHTDRSRFAPRVLCLHERGALADQVEALGVPVEVIGGPGVGAGAMLRRLVRRLRALAPDVLHTHNPAPHQFGSLARMLARIPVLVHTKHGRNYFTSTSQQMWTRVAGRLSDLVVPVSADAAEVARDGDWVPAGRIRVIRNGVDPGPVPAPRAGEPRRLIHVARLNEIKDQATLLRAMVLVHATHPDVTLDVIGDGDWGDRVRRLATDLGLDGCVRFHGMRDDVPAWLRRADLFVLSSESEGISITLLEAMAAGLPIVATDVGGNREVVVAGETGLLVPAKDPPAMAAAITALLDEPARALAMGAAGRRRVEAEFALELTVRAYEAAYDELLARRGGRTLAA